MGWGAWIVALRVWAQQRNLQCEERHKGCILFRKFPGGTQTCCDGGSSEETESRGWANLGRLHPAALPSMICTIQRTGRFSMTDMTALVMPKSGPLNRPTGGERGISPRHNCCGATLPLEYALHFQYQTKTYSYDHVVHARIPCFTRQAPSGYKRNAPNIFPAHPLHAPIPGRDSVMRGWWYLCLTLTN